jgi:hypothetical protein
MLGQLSFEDLQPAEASDRVGQTALLNLEVFQHLRDARSCAHHGLPSVYDTQARNRTPPKRLSTETASAGLTAAIKS